MILSGSGLQKANRSNASARRILRFLSMAGEWKTVPLGQIYEFSSGLSKPRSAFGSGYPFLCFKDVFYNSSVPTQLAELVNSTEQDRTRCSIRRGDVFVTRTSETMEELGMSCVALRDVPNATFNGFTKRLRPKTPDTVVPEYARYYFRAPAFRNAVTAMSSLSTRASLNNEMLERLSIVLPPPEEQEAIAHILGTLDDKIELNRRMKESLEAMARALFKSWFVDFDPVRAKMEGRWRKDESLLGLPAHLYDLFPDRLVDSVLGEIPEGWEINSVESLSLKVGMGPFGSNIKVSTFVEHGIPVISGQHLNNTMLEDRTYNFITAEHAKRLTSSNVMRGDVVFTHAGNIGQVSYIPDRSRYERYILSQRQFFLRCELTKISPLLMTYFFRSPQGQQTLLANTSQVGVPSIARPVSYLKSIQLITPPKAVSDMFDVIVRKLHHRISIARMEVAALAKIRDTLLPKLISGELRVKDTEKLISNVTLGLSEGEK
ncbi:MAG: restriction endonuclease subunit S [Acidobacteriota bacterium]|nr:restriction endonuclease subunit S [Acidobacteriota bacterium]